MTRPIMSVELANVPKLRSGKVREVFDLGDHLLIVATDRISAFDVIMPTGIPDKGAVLTQISNFWFDKLRDVVPHHVVATHVGDFPAVVREDPRSRDLAGRSVLVRKAEVLPVECIVRGYLAGSGWKDYMATGMTSGVELPPGLQLASRLPEPVFTPSTKAHHGHDENITRSEAARMIGEELAERIEDVAKRLYLAAREHAEACGLILADTKFEFGLCDGELLLVDEALTPDSSRFWDAELYRPGESPASFDKQFIRDYLEGLDWNKQAPGPVLPDDIVARTREKYLEAFRRLLGREFTAA